MRAGGDPEDAALGPEELRRRYRRVRKELAALRQEHAQLQRHVGSGGRGEASDAELAASNAEVARLRSKVAELEAGLVRLDRLERDVAHVHAKLDAMQGRTESAVGSLSTLRDRFGLVERDLGRLVTLSRALSSKGEGGLPLPQTPPRRPVSKGAPPAGDAADGGDDDGDGQRRDDQGQPIGWQGDDDGPQRPSGSMPAPRTARQLKELAKARRDVTLLQSGGTAADTDMDEVEDELITPRGDRGPVPSPDKGRRGRGKD